VEAPCPEIKVLENLTQDRSASMTDQAISPLRRRMIEEMTMRKFAPIHVLPGGFHRIRHYGLFAGSSRATISPRARCSMHHLPPTQMPSRRAMAPNRHRIHARAAAAA
jgi:Putative transposase